MTNLNQQEGFINGAKVLADDVIKGLHEASS